MVRGERVPSFCVFFSARALDSSSPRDYQRRAVLVVRWEDCLGRVPLGWVPGCGDGSDPEDQVTATW